ncbi:MAG: type II toxin-antitoxin system VapC family toxin [Solirubrobacterales bacterium]
MIADTSAVVAVLLRESRQEELAVKLDGAEVVAVGAPILLETGMVMVGAMGKHGRGLVALFLESFEVEVIPFGESHWQLAVEAFSRYGKGRHSAKLNFGDCMSYAVARIADEPLLYIGNDFAQTDIEAA